MYSLRTQRYTEKIRVPKTLYEILFCVYREVFLRVGRTFPWRRAVLFGVDKSFFCSKRGKCRIGDF